LTNFGGVAEAFIDCSRTRLSHGDHGFLGGAGHMEVRGSASSLGR